MIPQEKIINEINMSPQPLLHKINKMIYKYYKN